MSGIKEKMDDFINDVKSIPFSSPIASTSKSTKQNDDGDKMKVKLMEKWNKFKYEMSEGTELKINSPLWLLGECYYLEGSENSLEANADKNKQGKQQFRDDFASRPWFTYRKGFSPFSGTTLTSDTGWGCMIRTSQMMLCQGLFMHFLGRDWRRLLMRPEDLKDKRTHRMVVQWFIDEPNDRCPFSIHQLTEIGLTYKYKPGDWYGPSSMAYIMQDAVECGKGKNEALNNLAVYVAQDCAVYTKDVRDMCNWNHGTNQTRSVIILIPIRLGESSLNPVYIPCVQGLFTLKHCLGIVGGKPKHSLYFVGFQEDYLLYLDPHYSQVAHQLQSFSNKNLESYYSASPRKMLISKLDPSCCLGFYCKNEEEFEEFISNARKFLLPPQLKTNCPLFLFADGSVRDHNKYLSKTDKDSSSSDAVSSSCEFQASNEESQPSTSNQNDKCLKPSNSDPTSDVENGSEDCNVREASKSDKFAISLSNTRQFITNFYRQQSRSPKSKRKNISLEEEFEML